MSVQREPRRLHAKRAGKERVRAVQWTKSTHRDETTGGMQTRTHHRSPVRVRLERTRQPKCVGADWRRRVTLSSAEGWEPGFEEMGIHRRAYTRCRVRRLHALRESKARRIHIVQAGDGRAKKNPAGTLRRTAWGCRAQGAGSSFRGKRCYRGDAARRSWRACKSDPKERT